MKMVRQGYNNRILIKNNEERVDISDNAIVEYTGIYYNKINNTEETNEIKTTFIGSIQCEKYRHNENVDGFEGIYITPIYVWDKIGCEWCKIINYKPPQTKYFYYPHLLKLPEYICSTPYELNFLDTCKNRSLNEFTNIITPFLI